MKTDRELLELAAKAAGFDNFAWFENKVHGHAYPVLGHITKPWNPLTDDGDESRMEATLGLDVAWLADCVCVGDYCFEGYEAHGGDKQAARRKAGVRAAAVIGESM